MRRLAIILLLVPQLALGQGGGRGGTSPRDSLLIHAQRLVNQGQGAAGRALVDSLFRATREGSAERAEVLFVRATIAPSDSAAERDYQRLVVEHPISPRAADALVRLGLMEQMRGNRDRTKSYLERVKIEHPGTPAIAQAGYWLGRLYMEDNDVVRACAELKDSRAALGAGDVELRNQVDYYSQRCANLPKPAADSAPPGGQRTVTDTTVAGRRAGEPPKPDSATGARGRADSAAGARGGDSAGRAVTTGRAATSGGRGATAQAAKPGFSVQVAAFATKAPATTLAQRITLRGYEARVVGSAQPYKVWIGRYATRAEAAKVAQELKDKKITTGAFVVEATNR